MIVIKIIIKGRKISTLNIVLILMSLWKVVELSVCVNHVIIFKLAAISLISGLGTQSTVRDLKS